MRAILYRGARRGRWRWRITGPRDRVIAKAGHGYQRRADALAMLERAMDGFGVQAFEDREMTLAVGGH